MLSFNALYRHFFNHKERSWLLRPDSARALYSFVKKHDIKNVLDLGTGIGTSSAVVSLALKEKGVEHKIVTVENFQKCIDLAKQLIPDEIKENIEFKHSEAILWEHPDIAATYLSVFKDLPEGQFDLIIVDGPGIWLDEKGRMIEIPNGDVLKLHSEGKINPGTKIHFNGRMKALSILERFYGSDFFLLNEANNQDNFLERKDSPVTFLDSKKEEMKAAGYFSE